MTAITPQQLRDQFQAFASKSDYPDPQVAAWIATAALDVNAIKWGQFATLGVLYYACHHLTLERMAQDQGASHIPAGMTKGVMSAEGGDKLNASYDVTAATIKDKSFWNLTTYGIRYMYYADLAGIGPLQIGPAGFDPGGLAAAQGWVGPNPWPGPSTFG